MSIKFKKIEKIIRSYMLFHHSSMLPFWSEESKCVSLRLKAIPSVLWTSSGFFEGSASSK